MLQPSNLDPRCRNALLDFHNQRPSHQTPKPERFNTQTNIHDQAPADQKDIGRVGDFDIATAWAVNRSAEAVGKRCVEDVGVRS